ncbi:MAG TPA: DUF4231 domain-containing protein [Dehalococcoidia bacterium]|nr:DUF4231 domain-containing protein [Dehalococcoidia bacterium]
MTSVEAPATTAVAFGSDDSMPWLFRAADAASLAGQRRFMQLTAASLAVLLVAAASGPIVNVLTDSDATQRWSATVAAVAFIAAIIQRSFVLATRPERAWYDGRALAESAKTLAWRYAVGASPFEAGSDGADERFTLRLRAILKSFPDLVLEPGLLDGEQITPHMRGLRSAALTDRVAVYRQHRIEQQRLWYTSRALKHGKRGQMLGILTLLSESLGTVLAISFAASLIHTDLLSICAAAASGLIAWERAHQDTTLAKAYSVAAQELAAIRDLVGSQRDEEAWSQFVIEAETAISREHTLWRASRGGEAATFSDGHYEATPESPGKSP